MFVRSLRPQEGEPSVLSGMPFGSGAKNKKHYGEGSSKIDRSKSSKDRQPLGDSPDAIGDLKSDSKR